MPLKKHFLKPSIDTIPVKRWQLILHFVVILLLAYTFYLFTLYSYELMKLSYFNANPFEREFLYQYTLTPWFFKFSCAFFALLFSYTFFQKFLFYRPSFYRWHPLLRTRRHKVNLFHGARMLNYYFLDTASRFVVFLTLYGYEFWSFSLKTNINWLRITVVMSLGLLYFFQWNTIRRYFIDARKWQWIILGITLALAVIFVQIPIESLNSYYQNWKEKSYQYNYNIEIPIVENSTSLKRRSLVEYGVLAYPKKKEVSKPALMFDYANDGEPILYEEIPRFIKWSKEARSQADRHQLQVVLAVGQNVEMKYLFEVWNELRNANALHLYYYVKEQHEIFGKGTAFRTRLPVPCYPVTDNTDFEIYQQRIDTASGYFYIGCSQLEMTGKIVDENLMSLELVDNKVIINREDCSIDKLKAALFQKIKYDEVYLEIRIDEKSDFGHYLEVLDIVETLKEERKTYFSNKLFGKDWYELDKNEERLVHGNIQLYDIHFTAKEWAFVDYIRAQKKISD